MVRFWRMLAIVLPLVGVVPIVDLLPAREAAAQGRRGGDEDDEPRGGEEFRGRRGRGEFGPGGRQFGEGRGFGRGRGEGGEGARGEGGWRGRGNRQGNDDDERPTRSREGESSRGGDRSSDRRASSGGSGGMNMTSYARSLIQQNDRNGDGMLQADEQSRLRPPASNADSNGDKVITSEELIAAFSGGSGGATAGGAGGSAERGRGGRGSSDRGGTDSKTPAAGDTATRVFTALAGNAAGTTDGKTAEARRTYRFTPAAERLPNGLPASFKSRDRNEDGQISMDEFSRSWSDRTVRDFAQHDLNGDGIITPQEALKSNWR